MLTTEQKEHVAYLDDRIKAYQEAVVQSELALKDIQLFTQTAGFTAFRDYIQGETSVKTAIDSLEHDKSPMASINRVVNLSVKTLTNVGLQAALDYFIEAEATHQRLVYELEQLKKTKEDVMQTNLDVNTALDALF